MPGPGVIDPPPPTETDIGFGEPTTPLLWWPGRLICRGMESRGPPADDGEDEDGASKEPCAAGGEELLP